MPTHSGKLDDYAQKHSGALASNDNNHSIPYGSVLKDTPEIKLDDCTEKVSDVQASSTCELCVIPSHRLCNTSKQKAMSNDNNH